MKYIAMQTLLVCLWVVAGDLSPSTICVNQRRNKSQSLSSTAKPEEEAKLRMPFLLVTSGVSTDISLQVDERSSLCRL